MQHCRRGPLLLLILSHLALAFEFEGLGCRHLYNCHFLVVHEGDLLVHLLDGVVQLFGVIWSCDLYVLVNLWLLALNAR